MTVLAERFFHGNAVSVPPSNIERELREIWRQSAIESAGAVSRATMLTLVGHAETKEALAKVREVLDLASEQVPSRIILLLAEKDAPTSLKTSIAMNFHELGHGARQIYSEEIVIDACGEAVARLPSLVRTLRVADVPAILYWPGPVPTQGSHARGLMESVDRLVVDTQDFDNPRELAEFRDLLSDHLGITDLDWLRIQQWQALVAHLFDTPQYQEHVFGLDRVTIGHGPQATCDAFLFAGWLASSLGWTNPIAWVVDEGGYAWRCSRPDGGSVVVVIRAAGAEPGLHKVHLEAAGHGRPATFTVERMGRSLEIRGSQLSPKQRPVIWRPDVELLGSALRSMEGDVVFGRALEAAAEFVRCGT